MTSWLSQVFNFLAGGQYTTAPTPITPGSSGPLLCDQYGRLVVVQNGVGSAPGVGGNTWSNVVNPGASASVKTTAATLYHVIWSNEGAAKGWLMVFDRNTAPTTGAVPVLTFPVAAGVQASEEFPRGFPFANGIQWAVSSQPATYAALGGATFAVNTEYL